MGYPHFSGDCVDFHDRVIDWGRPKLTQPDCPTAPGEHHSYKLLSTQLGVQYWQCEWIGDASKKCGTRFEIKIPHWTAPKGIVTLCGSSRFFDQFMAENYRLTMAGYIVISLGFYPHSSEQAHGEGVGATSDEKVALDELHKRKIDLSDAIYVIDVAGYVGESTQSEIDYARAHHKPVNFMSEGNL